MNPKISELLDRIQHMEQEIELEMKRKRAELQADFEETRVRFEHEVLEQQRRFKTGLWSYVFSAKLSTALTAPIIYAVFFPMVLLDVAVTLYQIICFPVYGIARVKRSDYFVFDRSHLAYLNLLEKFNCAYCSYGNGLMAYSREVVARTEQYWCPIKHARKIMAAHPYYTGFVDFGDAEGYQRELKELRTELANLDKTQE
ncbi:MAG: hypothetical protein RLZ00_285 [Pseudomonadota bacterium]|jgi:hypothetical protein